MNTIDLNTWPRRRHFAAFDRFDYPHFNLCAPIDITTLYAAVKARQCSLNLAIVYTIARTANAIPEFRCRIRRLPDGSPQVVVHDTVHPSFTVLADQAAGGPAPSSLPGAVPAAAAPLPGTLPFSKDLPGEASLFGFCTVGYRPDFAAFATRAQASVEAIRRNPSLEDEPGRDDLLFMTAIPWVAFTGLEHPIHMHPADSVPRIAWGKLTRQGERLQMPLSVQAHHALMDGLHLARFYEYIQLLFDRPGEWLS